MLKPPRYVGQELLNRGGGKVHIYGLVIAAVTTCMA
jgi:hypothetical protein